MLLSGCSFFVTATNVTINNTTDNNLLIYIFDDSETKTIKLKANATTSVILKPETAYELTIYDYNSIYGDYTYYTITNCQTGSFNRKTWNISWDDEEKVYSLNGSLFF